MTGPGFPKSFSFENFIDGTLEAEMDMASQTAIMLPRLGRNSALGLASSLLVMTILVASLGNILGGLVLDAFFQGVLTPPGWGVVVFMALCSVLLALNLFSALLIFQGSKFQKVLGSRLDSVEALLSTDGVEETQEDPGMSVGPLEYMGSLTHDAFSRGSQLAVQAGTSAAVLLLSSVFFLGVLVFCAQQGLQEELYGHSTILLKLVLAVGAAASALSGLSLVENKRFYQWLDARNMFLKNIAASPPPGSTTEDGLLPRFKGLLEEEYGLTRWNSNITLHGSSGAMRSFDAYASSEKGSAFIRVAGCPSASDVESLAASVKDVLGCLDNKPDLLLAVLLCDDSEGSARVDDNAVLSIRDNIIPFSKGPGGGQKLAAVHIVLDHGSAYSFIPLPPPGKRRNKG